VVEDLARNERAGADRAHEAIQFLADGDDGDDVLTGGAGSDTLRRGRRRPQRRQVGARLATMTACPPSSAGAMRRVRPRVS
jgi:Ca2+-binding RTX toxin-like protein